MCGMWQDTPGLTSAACTSSMFDSTCSDELNKSPLQS